MQCDSLAPSGARCSLDSGHEQTHKHRGVCNDTVWSTHEHECYCATVPCTCNLVARGYELENHRAIGDMLGKLLMKILHEALTEALKK